MVIIFPNAILYSVFQENYFKRFRSFDSMKKSEDGWSIKDIFDIVCSTLYFKHCTGMFGNMIIKNMRRYFKVNMT